MALTATAANIQPFHPAFNEMIWVVSGSNVGQPNYRFLCEIYDGTNTTKLVPTIKAAPRTSDNLGIFDVHRILENYVSSELKIENVGFAQNATGIYAFKLRFGEEYGSTVAQTLNITTSSGTIYAVAASFSWLDFSSNPIETYHMGTTSKKFLTSSPHGLTTPLKIRSGQNAWLYMMYGVGQASVTTFNSAGATIATYKINNPYNGLTATADRYLRFASGTNNLNNIPSGSFTSGAQPIITASVASYSIRMENLANGGVSETVFYTIDDTCTEHTVYRLHFLNSYGGFDSFNFIRKSLEESDITRGKYKQNIGSISGTTWSYNKYDKTNTTLSSKYKDKVVVNTDWISEGEAAWLKELFTSPDVYYEQDSSTVVSVIISDVSYQKKKVANDRLIQYSLAFEFAHDNYKQRF